MRCETHLPRASSSLAIVADADGTASGPKSVRRSIRTWMSKVVALIGDGLTGYGESMYPSFFGSGEDVFLLYLRETRQPGERRRGREYGLRDMPADPQGDEAEPCRTRPGAPVPFAPDDDTRSDEVRAPGWGAWALSAPGRIWSALRQARAHRRTRLRLQSLDDETLKDIGIHRSQIDYSSWDENRYL